MASDIRQPTMDAKRFHDKKAKWAYGGRCARHYLSSRPRPAMPDTHYTRMTRLFKRNNESNLRHLSNDCSFDLTRDARELLADTDPSVKWTFVSRKNAPDVMIGYGDGAENNNSPDDRNDAPLLYEASGQTVLCDAVDKALEKFEVKETEKLVGEYEVVSHEHRASEAGMGYSAADEDGFEIVEYVPA